MVSKIKYLIVILFSVIFSDSYSQLNNEGVIIPCEELIMKCTQLNDGNFVIRNLQEYTDKIQNLSPDPACSSYDLPTIDFNQYSLIGFVLFVGGCRDPESSHRIIKLGNNYFFEIDVVQNGKCKTLIPIRVWCLIPKIEKESLVEFKVNKTINRELYEK